MQLRGGRICLKLGVLEEEQSITITASSMLAGRQTWHWSRIWEFISEYTNKKQREVPRDGEKLLNC